MKRSSQLKRSGFVNKGSWKSFRKPVKVEFYTKEDRKVSFKGLKTTLKRKKPKKKIQTISKLKKELWNECRRIVRARFNLDGEYYCFTCGNLTPIPHTGHIISSSLCSASLRYDLDNLRLQCYMCNIHKSGNWISFYETLGKDYIDELLRRNKESKFQSYHTDWYLKKIEEYRLL